MALVLYAGAWSANHHGAFVVECWHAKNGHLKFKVAKVAKQFLLSNAVPQQLSPIQAGLKSNHDHFLVCFLVCWPVQEDFQWPVYTLVDSVMPRKHQLDDIPAVDYLGWRWLSQVEIFSIKAFKRLGQTKLQTSWTPLKKTRLFLLGLYHLFGG